MKTYEIEQKLFTLHLKDTNHINENYKTTLEINLAPKECDDTKLPEDIIKVDELTYIKLSNETYLVVYKGEYKIDTVNTYYINNTNLPTAKKDLKDYYSRLLQDTISLEQSYYYEGNTIDSISISTRDISSPPTGNYNKMQGIFYIDTEKKQIEYYDEHDESFETKGFYDIEYKNGKALPILTEEEKIKAGIQAAEDENTTAGITSQLLEK